ncbi:hypothetical protein WJX74_000437 [Apatococcus lobatus]|uniref:Uncharacterized protein n=1 Tax=Apatococcus lobatus TaxID=904363 RepID=A0AAW1SDS6_9CHLO
MESQTDDAVALRSELRLTRSSLEVERLRSTRYAEELRQAKEQSIALHKQVELEQECITLKLMKRLEQLKREKQNLANEVEREEEYLTNSLQKRLQKLNEEKCSLEQQLEQDNKKLAELSNEKKKLHHEKIDLENQLEAEAEYIVNKLQKRVTKLAEEKAALQQEKSTMQRQVVDLSSAVDRLSCEKVDLERQFEMEEEGIVNGLQRKLEQVTQAYRALEERVEAHGLSMKTLQPLPSLDLDTELVYGRSPRQRDLQVDERRLSGSRRERSLSNSSSTSSQRLFGAGSVDHRSGSRDIRGFSPSGFS